MAAASNTTVTIKQFNDLSAKVTSLATQVTALTTQVAALAATGGAVTAANVVTLTSAKKLAN